LETDAKKQVLGIEIFVTSQEQARRSSFLLWAYENEEQILQMRIIPSWGQFAGQILGR
jgi:hypothetical protein